MKHIKNTISFILAAVLLFCAVPLTTSAVRTVDEVIILNYEYPLIGITPADMPKLDAPDGADYVIDDCCWVVDSTKEELGMDEPFQAGVRYCMMIRIIPEEDCEFSRFVSINVSGDIDQGELLIRPSEITVYTPPVKPYAGRIAEVVIDGFKVPEPGQVFDSSFAATVPNGAHYTLSLGWFYSMTGEFVQYNDKFILGESYTFYAYVEPAENYCFSNDAVLIVNGDDMTVDEKASTFKKSFIEIYSKPILLYPDDAEFTDLVEVFGVTDPAVGQTAGENLAAITFSDNCIAADIGWNSSADEYVEEYETFSPGGVYYMYFCVFAADGCAFDPLSFPQILINGKSDLVIDEYTYYTHADGRLMLVFFTRNMEAIPDHENPPITEVSVNGFTVPTVGETADENLALLTSDDDAPYDFSARWHCTAGGDVVMDGGSVFEKGKTYYLSLSVFPKDGCYFDKNNLPTVLLNGSDQYIDGYYTRYYEAERTLSYFTTDLTPQAAPVVNEAIKSVAVNGYQPPFVGQTAGKNLETLTAYGSGEHDFVYALWHNATDDEYMTDSDKFEAGKTYRLEFRFRAEEGFFFDPDALPAITVNGDPGLVDGALTYTDSDRLQLTFYVSGISPFMRGDCNGDCKIDGKDLIRLRRHLVGIEVDLFAGADCSGDGEINGKDLIRLRKYLLTEDASLLIPR